MVFLFFVGSDFYQFACRSPVTVTWDPHASLRQLHLTEVFSYASIIHMHVLN